VEECAAAKTHEAPPQFYKSNGSAAQTVCFPATFSNTMASKQALRDLAVAISFLPSIQCAQREYLPTLLQSWQSKRRRPERPMLKRKPQSMCGLHAKPEIRIERQIEGDSRPTQGKLTQPKAMLRSPERHDRMPSIRRATKHAARQIGAIELAAFGRHAVGCPHMKDGRQHLGCPEHCLRVESLLRISWKTRAPTSAGTGPPLRLKTFAAR